MTQTVLNRTNAERSKPEISRQTRAVAMVLWAVAIIYLIGTILDLGILWVLQRQDNVQWEFVAVTRTVEGWPRMILAVAAAFLALYVRGNSSRIAFGLLGAVLIVLGLGGAGLGALAVMEYLPLHRMAEGAGADMLRSSTVKTLTLSALYFLLLVPAGVLALRGPRRS